MPERRRHLLVMLLVGWPVLSVLVHGGRLEHWIDDGATAGQALGRFALWAGVGAALAAPTWAAWERWCLGRGSPAKQLATLVGLCLVSGLVFAGLLEQGEWPIPHPDGHGGPPFWVRATTPVLAMVAWAAVQFTWDTSQRLAQQRERVLQAEALATEARLAMLRAELHPHFLFNALNSIIGVIDERPAHAQQMVRQLAGLLRHSLSSPARSTLGMELEVAGKYLAIEQVRFEERLQVSMDVPDELQRLPVPAMLLQPLVENAVKHGMDVAPLTVRVEAERTDGALIVRVSNPGRLRANVGGVGLRNLEERLHTYADGGTLEIAQQGPLVVATVTLPLADM